jgi:hypothetical protein
MFKKYSDFCKIEKYIIFQIFARYNIIMTNNFDKEYPQYDNWPMKIFSDFCCESCSCKSENDHKKRPDTVETESGLILNGIVND